VSHFKLTLAYDGATFVGWQRQAAGVSIQGLLEDALARIDNGPVSVAGAGRTDAGVHALGQVASFALRREIDPETLRRALNAHLPPAIRVVDSAAADARFHARFDAKAKTYRYRIWNDEVLSPFERSFVWHFPSPRLDIQAMDTAARLLEGTHDFASFQGAGATTATTARTVWSSRVTGGPLITYEVCGSGFLKHMVRVMTGTLVDVGRGRRAPASIAAVLEGQSRACAGETAPASGLFLVGVSYESPDVKCLSK
jgi:tRNA pseudouridine38-40 synthase